MANDGERCDGCNCIGYEDVVEHKMNTNIFGIVVGFQGSLIGIRVSPSLDLLWFHEWELQHIGDDDYTPPVEDEADNIVNLADYRLKANSKTKGVA